MTLQELKDKANPILVDFYQSLVSHQEAFHTLHGRYFSLLISSDTDIVDGVDSDFLTRLDDDEANQGDIDFTYSTKIPCTLECHRQADGFDLEAIFKLTNDKKYARKRKYPSGDDTGWFECTGNDSKEEYIDYYGT